ncbi:uncharacterized protein LOC133847909 [Drosophila sulfurigaster albostrigata]|uniref:uncharacterized protein LOC133847909 n=1 Tax=Drosophila sulfurigaster albostrigata TaxID=89887 RepID=UPI002D21A061|nr:uncharacterized protein LOC133847909 [Drosophila sulfurigaster albostrigata]
MSDLPITQMIYQPVWKQAPESFLANALFQLTCFIYSPYALAEIKLKSEAHEPNAFGLEFSWLVKLCIAAALLGLIPIYIMWLKCVKPKTSAYIELDVIPDRPPEQLVENLATEVSLATIDDLDELRGQREEQEANLPSTSGRQQQQKPVAIARKKISIERETQTQNGSQCRKLNSMQRQQRTSQTQSTQTQSQPLAQSQSQVQTPVVTLRKPKNDSHPVWHS